MGDERNAQFYILEYFNT